MPLNHITLSPAHQEFCRALRAARERKGLTLAQIAAETKIPASLFEGLECGDVSRWPAAVFRRSYFRDYARIIGLHAPDWCDEFLRLFPERPSATSAPPPPRPVEVAHSSGLRLVIDTSWTAHLAQLRGRARIAAIDVVSIMATALVIAWLFTFDRGWTTAAVALIYVSIGTLAGSHPGRWASVRGRALAEALPQSRFLLRMRGRRAPAAAAPPDAHAQQWPPPTAADQGVV